MRTRISSSIAPSIAVKRVKGYTAVSVYNSWGSGANGARNRAAKYGTVGTVAQTLPITSTIVDEPRGYGRVKYKPATHTRTWGAAGVPYVMQRWTDSTTQCYFSGGYVPKIPVPASPIGLSSLDIVLLRMEARDALIPQFEAEFQGASFIAELKDFSGLVSILGKAGDRISNLAQAISDTFTPVRWNKKERQRYLELPLGAANAQLTTNLSVKPLASDICTLHNALRGMRDHLEKFNTQGSIVNRRHYIAKREEPWTLKQSAFENDSYRVEEYETRYLTFTAAADLTYVHVVDNELDLFLQHYGLRLTPSTVWNYIPLSFVVDYFFSVGKMMESMSRYGGTDFKVRNYQESIRSVTSRVKILSGNQTKPNGHPAVLTYSAVDGNLDFGDFPVPVGGVPIAYGASVNYDRSPVMPFPEDGIRLTLPRFKWPNLAQSLNLGALATAFSYRR